MFPESPITNHTLLHVGARDPRPTDIRSALAAAIAQLEAEEVPSAPLAAELLLMHALEHDRAWLYAHPEEALSDAAREKYFAFVAQRARGVPTQYLTGHQEFWGLDFEVTPAVLIPRPETEHVIEVALDRLGIAPAANSLMRERKLRIADVGTGSGCIAIALAMELPGAHITASDISAAALEIARRNAARLGVAERIDFIESNLLDAVFHESQITSHESQPFDLIASNPPYVARRTSATLAREVCDHEPEVALYGGETGTEIYAPLIAQAAHLLKPGGFLVLELGHDSANRVMPLLHTKEWTDCRLTNDLAGIARVASAQFTA
jgi:release factor glutamine methyltransferase